jgi:hypothetical protein
VRIGALLVFWIVSGIALDHSLTAKRILEPSGVRSSDLSDFLVANLKGSSLQVKKGEKNDQLVVSSPDSLLEIRIVKAGKKIEYEVYSPALKRRVRVEELGGFDYMESGVEDELHQLSLDMTADDALLAIDLTRSWAKANAFQIVEKNIDEHIYSEPARKNITRKVGRPRKNRSP